jgi:hypothetical protein
MTGDKQKGSSTRLTLLEKIPFDVKECEREKKTCNGGGKLFLMQKEIELMSFIWEMKIVSYEI